MVPKTIPGCICRCCEFFGEPGRARYADLLCRKCQKFIEVDLNEDESLYKDCLDDRTEFYSNHRDKLDFLQNQKKPTNKKYVKKVAKRRATIKHAKKRKDRDALVEIAKELSLQFYYQSTFHTKLSPPFQNHLIILPVRKSFLVALLERFQFLLVARKEIFAFNENIICIHW